MLAFDSTRLSQRREGQSTLGHLMLHKSKIRIVHYSCESFSSRAPRITSISVYDFDSKQIESFSIHLSAQEIGRSCVSLMEDEVDELEKHLLKKFFMYVRANKSCKWVHWKMKDLAFGFKALELRFRALKGRPTKIQNENKYDLSEILKLIYSSNYETNGDIGKLLSLARRNGWKLKRALPGIDEAKAFDEKEYQLLHHSTQQKVEGLAFILEAAKQDKLKVAARFYQIYGLDLAGAVRLVQEHPIYSLLSILATVAPFYSSLAPSEETSLGLLPTILEAIKLMCSAVVGVFTNN